MACVGIRILRCLKVEMAWDTEKWLQVIRLCYLKQLYHQGTKNKDILNLNNIVRVAMKPLVMYFNCFVIYYQLMLLGSNIKVLFNHYTVNNDYTWYYQYFKFIISDQPLRDKISSETNTRYRYAIVINVLSSTEIC